MSEKHTPGPWRVFTNPDGTKIIGIGDQSGEGVTDCGFGVWRGGSEEAFANAHLIAAAPELLSEMKRLYRAYVSLLETGRDRIVSHGGTCDPVDVMEANSPSLRDARAIIAKAQGSASLRPVEA